MVQDQFVTDVQALVVAVKDLAIIGKSILKDGKIGIDDLPTLLTFLQKKDDLIAAFSAAKDLPTSASQFQVEDSAAIIEVLISAFKDVQAA